MGYAEFTPYIIASITAYVLQGKSKLLGGTWQASSLGCTADCGGNKTQI